MAKSNLTLRNEITAKWVQSLIATYGTDNDVLQIASGTLAIPVVDSEGGERWVELKVILPKCELDNGDFDGYEEAESYRIKCEEKSIKAKELAEKKAKKIAKDTEKRKAKADAKADKSADAVDFEAPFEAGFETDIARKD